MTSKRLKMTDQSQDKSLVLKSAEFRHKDSTHKKEDRTYVPSKLQPSSSKKSLKGNRSLGNLKQTAALKEVLSVHDPKKKGNKTMIECDLRMPGKKAQCIRKVKAAFSEITDSVASRD